MYIAPSSVPVVPGNMEEDSEVGLAPLISADSQPNRRRRSPRNAANEETSRRPPSSRLKQVAIGSQLERWDRMKSRLGLESHAQLAEIMLDGMEAIVDGDVVWGLACTDPKLRSKLTNFFKRKGIPALMELRSPKKTTPKKKKNSNKKLPVKLKIRIRKDQLIPMVTDTNGQDKNQDDEDEEEEEDEDDEDDTEVEEDDEEPSDHSDDADGNDNDEEYDVNDEDEDELDDSAHLSSRHGLKKAWLGRHLKGKRKTIQTRKRPHQEVEAVEGDEAGTKEPRGPLRKIRQARGRRQKTMKRLKRKKRSIRNEAKTIAELFGADAVLTKVYCCRKCTSQLDSADVMKAHWQMHLAEEDDVKLDGDKKATQGETKTEGELMAEPAGSKDGEKRKEGGDDDDCEIREDGDGEDGDQEVPADIKGIARVLTRCPLCQKLFSNIMAHTACHSNYLCEECGIMFRQRRSLKLHRRALHELGETGQLPFVCNRCGRAFRWEASLRKHRTLHSQHRQFICQTCGKSFKVQAHLKRHEIMHEEVKPFVCPHCGRRFTEHSNMKVHTRVHTGEKPYICDVCKKAYAHKVSLKTHKKKEHGIDMWQLGYITQPVIEFDDEGKETPYSIARRSRRPSATATSAGGRSKKKRVGSEKADQVSQLVRVKNQEKSGDFGVSSEVDKTNANQQMQTTSQTSAQHYTDTKIPVPLQHSPFQQQQEQHVQIQPARQASQLLQQQHLHAQQQQQQQQQQHLPQMHSQSLYPQASEPPPHQHIEDDDEDDDEDINSEPCSPVHEDPNPRLLQADLLTTQMHHVQRLSNNHHPPQPLQHQQPPPPQQQQQQQQQMPPHTQTQPLPHMQVPSTRQLPPQIHQPSHRPTFETIASPDRQGHSQYRQGMMNTMPSGLDLNALVAGSMQYMYWGSQQYQGAPSYLQRNNDETPMESPKQ